MCGLINIFGSIRNMVVSFTKSSEAPENNDANVTIAKIVEAD